MRGKSILLLEPGSFLKRMLGGICGGIRRRDNALALLRHELRTPLTGILGMAALLRESRLDTEQLQLLKALEQSGRQLADLLEHSGAWLKTGRTSVPANATTFNGLHLLEGITRAHWPAASHRGLGIFLVFDHRLPVFWRTEPALLRETLDNLLNNAIKFTPRGGCVLLEARRFAGNDKVGEGIELRVSDTGIGIPRRDERRIYSMGVRGSEDQARLHSGSGYGLFICNRVTAALGGSLNHVRIRSGGTRFTMRLPGAAVAAAEAGERLRPRLLRGLHCGLSLPPPLDRVVAHALRRMDISVTFLKGDAREVWPEHLDARITIRLDGCDGVREEGAGGSEPPAAWHSAVCGRPVLMGRPGLISPGIPGFSPREFSAVLHEPVLHANLEPLMLQFALHLRGNGQ